ncbi:MAG: helix-hairpin-helix domain-containing protein [Candidatus Aminicenantes bacterium]|jgi:nucleotidyltransferase/DNA polymerase involved in DNA repair
MIRQNERSEVIKRLQTLRNIGPATAEKLYSMGIETPEQLKQSSPEKLYEKLRHKAGGKLDKCVLYQLQGAILDIPWPECKGFSKDSS